MEWTALDLKNLAALADDLAQAVLDFRLDNGQDLSTLQKNTLIAQFEQLTSYGEKLENEAVQQALVDIDGAVVDLQTATHDATHALTVISDIQKVITIGTAAVGLFSAIFDPTPGTIAGSLNTLVTAIKGALAGSTDKPSS